MERPTFVLVLLASVYNYHQKFFAYSPSYFSSGNVFKALNNLSIFFWEAFQE